MLDRLRIRTLRDADHTLKEIAATVGAGKRSVQRILKEPPITRLEAAPTPRSRGIERPRTVEVYQPDAQRILNEDASLPTMEVLSGLHALSYSGGKSAIDELVWSIRPLKIDAPQVRFEDVPGLRKGEWDQRPSKRRVPRKSSSSGVS